MAPKRKAPQPEPEPEPNPPWCDHGHYPTKIVQTQRKSLPLNPKFQITTREAKIDNKNVTIHTWISEDIRVVPTFFDQGDSTTCWAVTTAKALHCYKALFGEVLPPTRTLWYSCQSIVDCLPCDIPESMDNWMPDENSYTWSTLGALEYTHTYGVPLMEEYPWIGGHKHPCKPFRPVVAPEAFQDFKMYEDYADDEKVVSNEELIEELRKGPMLGTFTVYKDYKKYKGEVDGIYYGLRRGRPREDPEYHAILVTGYGFDKKNKLFFECHNSAEGWGKSARGFVARSLFITMQSLDSVIDVVMPRLRDRC